MEPESKGGYSFRTQAPGEREHIIRRVSGSLFFFFPSTQVLTPEVKRKAQAGSGRGQVMQCTRDQAPTSGLCCLWEVDACSLFTSCSPPSRLGCWAPAHSGFHFLLSKLLRQSWEPPVDLHLAVLGVQLMYPQIQDYLAGWLMGWFPIVLSQRSLQEHACRGLF